jgi:SulP family sulfate permease
MVDASGMHALKEFHQKCYHSKTILLLSGVQGRTQLDLEKFGLTQLIGQSHIFSNIDDALVKSKELIVDKKVQESVPCGMNS